MRHNPSTVFHEIRCFLEEITEKRGMFLIFKRHSTAFARSGAFFIIFNRFCVARNSRGVRVSYAS